ncbi:MAG: hypothetical protein LBK83_08090 [Treponema sp.]|jgi:hypothetical protein|nr:hypothetical protein [Treponema sp.]
MTTKPFFLFLAATILTALYSCASGGSVRVQSSGPAQTPEPSPYFSGDGGKGKSIAILAPRAAGLTEAQDYIPALVQGELVSNFSGYSALSVLDRQRLDDQYAELLSGYYDDNAEAGLDLGHLPPAGYIMGGTITRTATGYTLQISITKTADKMTAASYSGTCTFAELDNLSGVRRASLELLEKMGVTPTGRTRTELAGAAAGREIGAQTALARGITAQRDGTEIAALSYYIQSAAFDENLAEAAGRLTILTANITSGDMGADIRSDLQWRDQWVARLTECEEFFAKNVYGPYPYYLVYSTDIRQGATDYEKRTVSLSVTIGSYPDPARFKAMEQVVRTVRAGLQATGRAKTWRLDQWPLRAAAIPGLFNVSWSESNGPSGTSRQETASSVYCSGYSAVVEIVNSDGKTIASRAIGFPQGFYASNAPVSSGEELRFAIPVVAVADLVFPSVDPNDMTGTMAIRIASINGQSAETWARANRLSILSEAEYQKTSGVISLRERIVEENYRGEKRISYRARSGAAGNTPGAAYRVLGLVTADNRGLFGGRRSIEHPDRTVWERTSGSSSDGYRFYMIHHEAAAPQDLAGSDSDSYINIYPSTTKSFSGDYRFYTGSPSKYLPVSAITVPAGAFLGRSIYLGANLTLTASSRNSQPLIDAYNQNGKKEGWYVYNSYTDVQWSTLGIAHTDMYTYISQTGKGAYYVQEHINNE